MQRGTLKTTQLQMLVAIAEHGTLMAAADALNLSQPAVTKGVKELETRLDVQLLERSGTGIRLTQFGETLLRRARSVVADITRAEQEIAEMRSGAERTLSIGISLLASSIAMPDALEAFRHRRPEVKLNIYECAPEQIVDGLRDGTFDLCVGFIGSSNTTAECRVITIKESAEVLAVRAGDSLGKLSKLEHLTETKWLYNDTRESFPAFWRNLCGDISLPLPSQLDVCTSQRLYAQLAQEPRTVSVWPEPLLEAQIKAGRMQMINTDARLIRLTLGLLYRRDLVLRESHRQFIECLRHTSGVGA